MNTLLIDYEALATDATKALRRVVQMLTRAGIGVSKVESDGKTKRTAGTQYREVHISLIDNQTLSFRVKATGDIAQVLINDKLVALRHQDNPIEAVKELTALLDRTRAAHQKRLAAMVMKPPEGIKTAAPKLKEVLTQQIAAVDAEIVDAKAELEALTTAEGAA